MGVNILLVNISFLLSNSPGISKQTLAVRPKIIFYLTIGLWLLIVVVLTNAYVGVVVSTLTIPPPWLPKWSRFEEPEDFVIYTTPRGWNIFHYDDYMDLMGGKQL